MTLRSPICSKSLAILLVAVLPSQAATLAGKVELRDSKEAAVVKGQNYSGAVVWLKPAAGGKPAPGQARMLQSDKRFSPHILAIPVGTRVDFPNLDPIFHNAFSNFDGKLFDVGLYPPGGSRSVTFDRPGIVRVFCNIHPMMSAVIVVVDAAYFAVSAKDGTFRIPNVPPGDYQLRVFHERASQETLDKLDRTITIATADAVIPPIVISETGYLMMPHKNKFGREYPPVPDDSITYSGSKK